jgi:hypothetical protein
VAGSLLAALLAVAVVGPVAAATVKYQASGGPTGLHLLGYFRLLHPAPLKITVTLSAEPCQLTVDAYRQKDAVNDRFADFWTSFSGSPQSETFAAKPGRYKVKVESSCASWSFVIAKTS